MRVQGKPVIPVDWKEYALGLLRTVWITPEQARELIAKNKLTAKTK